MSAASGLTFGFDPHDLRSPERVARLEMERVIALSLEGIAPRTVLDAGTGTGLAAEAFTVHGLSVTGLDASDAMLGIARAYLPTGAFVQSILERLPFSDSAFDLFFMGHVLHETTNVEEALRETRRVTRVRAAILEWPYEEPVPQGDGPPAKRRLEPVVVVSAAHAAGFRRARVASLSQMVLYRLDVREV